MPSVFNRMNDTIDGSDIYYTDMDMVPLWALIGMVFWKPNPFPKSIVGRSESSFPTLQSIH